MASTAAPLIQFSALSVSCVAGLLLLLSLARIIYLLRRRKQETRLRGPTSPSRLLGFMRVLHENEVKGQGVDLHIRWAKQFGGVYELPYPLGASRLVVVDTRALAHVFAKDTTVYAQTELQRTVVEMLVYLFTYHLSRYNKCNQFKQSGKNLMYVEGDSHTKSVPLVVPEPGCALMNADNDEQWLQASATQLCETWLQYLKNMLSRYMKCSRSFKATTHWLAQLKTEWETVIGSKEYAILDVGEW